MAGDLPHCALGDYWDVDYLSWFRNSFRVLPHFHVGRQTVAGMASGAREIPSFRVLLFSSSFLSATITLPGGLFQGSISHQLTKNLFYLLQVTTNVFHKEDLSIHRFLWRRKYNTLGISVHPEKKIEFDFLQQLDQIGNHALGASISLYPGPSIPLESIEEEKIVSSSLAYRWRSIDNRKIACIKYISEKNRILLTIAHKGTVGGLKIISSFRLLQGLSSSQSGAILAHTLSSNNYPCTFSVRLLSTKSAQFMLEGKTNSILRWNIFGSFQNLHTFCIGGFIQVPVG